MNLIKIGEQSRPLAEASEQWINEQLRRRRTDGGDPCVQIILKTDFLDMVLSTPQCYGGGGGGRRPNAREQQLFDLWAKRGLNELTFDTGNLMSFLRQAASAF